MTVQGPDSGAVDSLEGALKYGSLEKRDIVGTGSNATIYETTVDDGSDRVVALKEPHVPDADAPRIVDRFRTEAETWATLNDHNHVVTVLAWDTDPHPWLVLEYMDGGNLVEQIGECGVATGIWIGSRVAAALHYAHRNGIAHLDVKPENVLFSETSPETWAEPKVADWGMAAFLQAETTNLEGLSPRYAAPEQYAPDRYGPTGVRTDVYQLGVVLYELLVETPPFDGPPRVLRDAILEETPPPPSGRNSTLPVDVDDVLDRALAKDPSDRYDSMDAFRQALEGLLASRETPLTGESTSPSALERESTPEPAPIVRSSPSAVTSPYERALTLADEGFVQLSNQYFARRDPAPPLEAWRRGVTLADAHAGRAIERTVPESDADEGGGTTRTSLTDLLLDGLTSGSDHVVLGPPGSGKSTVCKRVACEWFERGYGPVFYRESGRGERFDQPDALARHVTDTDGHALVVVEDAVRPEANAAFEFLDRVADTEDVTVLLDAREAEWREAGRRSTAFGTDPVVAGREALDPVYVPRPDAREHERFVRAVEATTDRSVNIDVEQLQVDIREAATSDPDGDETRPGELFYLLHRLTALARDPLEGSDATTTLTDAVRDVYERLADLGDEALDVGVCVNVCNAAGIGVHPELLYAVVPDHPLAVDDAIKVLDGRAVFPREADWSGGTTAYPAVHEAWATAFLVHCLNAEGEADASERFGRVVTRVISLADDAELRGQVDGALNGDAPYLARIEPDQRAWADETVEAVYGLGRKRPKLAPLFGGGERDSIELPGACSDRIVEQRPVWLGRIFLAGGYFDRAQGAFERLPREVPDRAVERLLGLSRIAVDRGNYDDAKAYAEECLVLVGDDRSVVRGRAELLAGRSQWYLGDFVSATEHHRIALGEFETVGNRRRAAEALNNLGLVACIQGEYDRAREHHRRSLNIRRELGDRRGMASSLHDLGTIVLKQGEYDRARGYFERSVEIKREIGDQQGEADSLVNLGVIAHQQGKYDRARDYFHRSLEFQQELGDQQGVLTSLNHLGLIARRQGEYDRAHEYFERSHEVGRKLGDRLGETYSLSNLGTVDVIQGAFDQARKYHERNFDVARDVGAPFWVAKSQYRLGEVARRRGEYDRAREYFNEALGTLADGGNQFETSKIRLARGRLALARGDVDLARERTEEAHEAFAEMGATHWEGRSRRLLGRVAAKATETESAREHWRAALETFETVGAPQDALATLEYLVETSREAGDQAEQWCRRATELLDEAPEVVVDQHRGWVRRRCSDLDDG